MNVNLTYKEKQELLKILREQEVRLKGAIEATTIRADLGDDYFKKHLVKLKGKLATVIGLQEKLRQLR